MDDFAHIVGEDVHFRGRSPPGERGLKSVVSAVIRTGLGRRSPPGERGLKSMTCNALSRTIRRSPPGERGLK